MVSIIVQTKAMKVQADFFAQHGELLLVSQISDELLENKGSLLLANEIRNSFANCEQDSAPLVQVAGANQTLEHVVSVLVEDDLLQVG